MTWFLLKKFGPPIAGAALLAALLWGAYSWAYGRGEAAGAADVQLQWDKQRAANQLAVEQAQKDVDAAVTRANKIAKEIQDALEPQIDAADARARDIAGRLLHSEAGLAACRRAAAAVATAEPAGASGVAESVGAVGQATEEFFAACARDAERLNSLNRWFDRVWADWEAAR
jgi:hypothetical protein